VSCRTSRLAVFDLDGTLLDTDEALVAPFIALGVAPEEVTFGHVLADECTRLGIDVDAFLGLYDTDLAQPFAGVVDLLTRIEGTRWAVCSNKHPRSGHAELDRLGWKPEVALFNDAFDGPKQLGPVLVALGVTADEIVFVGDTGHDRRCAAEIGAPFGLAGWNPRTRAEPGDAMLHAPLDVLALLER
jgi:HAD superfamily hydrolase (TIGR01549 family)